MFVFLVSPVVGRSEFSNKVGRCSVIIISDDHNNSTTKGNKDKQLGILPLNDQLTQPVLLSSLNLTTYNFSVSAVSSLDL